MLKYVSKFAMDILPSVVATIIGAYIVNHYIVTKPDTPIAAVSSADPKKADATTDARADAKPSAGIVGSLPQRGVTAKGISEKAMIEQTAAERQAVAEKPVAADKPVEKSADKPAETASVPAETRRHAPAPREREKVIAKSVTAPVAPSAAPAVAAAPIVAAPATVPAAEAAAAAPEEHRDATELARAAIERLRGAGDGSPRPQEAARVTEAPRIVATPPVAAPVALAPAIRPLPPPIMVSTPAADSFNAPTGSTAVRPAGIDDPRRPTPPADIPGASPSLSLPSPGPLDLRADAVEPQRREHTNVAEDMLLAAKSVFHAVLPK
jgi:hypothetical protein